MIELEDAEPAAAAMLAATQATARDYARGDVGDEDDFSGQLVGRLKQRLESFDTTNLRWQVPEILSERTDGPARPSVRFSGRRLRSRGKLSEERVMGADLVLVLEVRTPHTFAKKGLLVQSKRLEPGNSLPVGEAQRLRSQCKAMLNITAAGFVFIYSTTGVRITSAAAVEATDRNDLHALAVYPPQWFFLDFMVCWIGDPRIRATDRESLVALRAAANARAAALIRATSKTEGSW